MIPNAYVFCKIKPQTLVNGGHSQMKCIQCQRQSHMINSAFKNQHYAPMFILKDVYEEATIPEYKQNNSIKQEIIMQNQA